METHPTLLSKKPAASHHDVKQTKFWPGIIQNGVVLDPPLVMKEFTESNQMEPILARPPCPYYIIAEKDVLEKRQTPCIEPIVAGSLCPFNFIELEVDDNGAKKS